MFQELIHQILEIIKNEPFFQWPNRIGGDPTRRDQSIHCQYHQEQGHTTEDCRTLWSYLEQLVKVEKLKQFLHQPNGQSSRARLGAQREASARPSLGTINVIFAAPRRIDSQPSRVISVARPPADGSSPHPKRSRVKIQPILSISDEDKVGNLKSQDYALIVTLMIGGYNVKKLLVD